MRENTLREIWARGEAVVNGWLSIPSSFSAEVMAHQGFDSLTVDLQHGVIDYQTAVTMLQAISTTPVIPLARVPWNDPALLTLASESRFMAAKAAEEVSAVRKTGVKAGTLPAY